MPAVPSSVIEPVWAEFAALIPPRLDTHPLGCHRPRIPDRVVFDKLVQSLVVGAAYARIADDTCSATTIRTRRDEWIDAGIFDLLEQACLSSRRVSRAGVSGGRELQRLTPCSHPHSRSWHGSGSGYASRSPRTSTPATTPARPTSCSPPWAATGRPAPKASPSKSGSGGPSSDRTP